MNFSYKYKYKFWQNYSEYGIQTPGLKIEEISHAHTHTHTQRNTHTVTHSNTHTHTHTHTQTHLTSTKLEDNYDEEKYLVDAKQTDIFTERAQDPKTAHDKDQTSECREHHRGIRRELGERSVIFELGDL